MYEAIFKVTHDCLHVRLTQEHPGIKIYVWCNYQNEIIEIVADNPTDYEQILEHSLLTDNVITRSSNGHNIHLIRKLCTCNIKNSVAKNAEQANVMHLTPIIIYQGWEHHRVISFEHDHLTEFMRLLEENGFTYKIEKKSIIEGQLSSTLILNIDSIFSNLTKNQLDALLTAYRHGYFVFPRKMNLQTIASKEKVVRTTLSEHLKKGQNKVFSNLIPYLYLYQEKND